MLEVNAFMGLVGGLVIGAALAWMALGTANPYGRWLGCRCWVRSYGSSRWSPHHIVAVSWMGAVCVRADDRPDDDGYWIKKQNVRWRVRWDEPGEDG